MPVPRYVQTGARMPPDPPSPWTVAGANALAGLAQAAANIGQSAFETSARPGGAVWEGLNPQASVDAWYADQEAMRAHTQAQADRLGAISENERGQLALEGRRQDWTEGGYERDWADRQRDEMLNRARAEAAAAAAAAAAEEEANRPRVVTEYYDKETGTAYTPKEWKTLIDLAEKRRTAANSGTATQGTASQPTGYGETAIKNAVATDEMLNRLAKRQRVIRGTRGRSKVGGRSLGSSREAAEFEAAFPGLVEWDAIAASESPEKVRAYIEAQIAKAKGQEAAGGYGAPAAGAGMPGAAGGPQRPSAGAPRRQGAPRSSVITSGRPMIPPIAGAEQYAGYREAPPGSMPDREVGVKEAGEARRGGTGGGGAGGGGGILANNKPWQVLQDLGDRAQRSIDALADARAKALPGAAPDDELVKAADDAVKTQRRAQQVQAVMTEAEALREQATAIRMAEAQIAAGVVDEEQRAAVEDEIAAAKAEFSARDDAMAAALVDAFKGADPSDPVVLAAASAIGPGVVQRLFAAAQEVADLEAREAAAAAAAKTAADEERAEKRSLSGRLRRVFADPSPTGKTWSNQMLGGSRGPRGYLPIRGDF